MLRVLVPASPSRWRLQRLVAFALVGVIGLGELLSNRQLQMSALLLIAPLIVSLLFQTQALLERTIENWDSAATPDWYSDYLDAVPLMKMHVRERLATGRPVEIRWFCVTGHVAWPCLRDLLSEPSESGTGRLRVEVALADTPGRGARSTKQAADATAAEIERFVKRHAVEFAGRVRITVRRYRERPQWHALLVDDDLLFFSHTTPSSWMGTSPEGGVEVIEARSGNAAKARIRHFVEWFEQTAVAASSSQMERAELDPTDLVTRRPKAMAARAVPHTSAQPRAPSRSL